MYSLLIIAHLYVRWQDSSTHLTRYTAILFVHTTWVCLWSTSRPTVPTLVTVGSGWIQRLEALLPSTLALWEGPTGCCCSSPSPGHTRVMAESLNSSKKHFLEISKQPKEPKQISTPQIRPPGVLQVRFHFRVQTCSSFLLATRRPHTGRGLWSWLPRDRRQTLGTARASNPQSRLLGCRKEIYTKKMWKNASKAVKGEIWRDGQ